MFRKKGGGATGIMASGPELIKAQSGTFVNIPGGAPVARRKRSAPAKHRKAVPKVPPKVLTALISDCMPWLKPLAH